MVAIYLAAGEESMAAEVVHNNRGGLLLLLIIMILFLIIVWRLTGGVRTSRMCFECRRFGESGISQE